MYCLLGIIYKTNNINTFYNYYVVSMQSLYLFYIFFFIMAFYYNIAYGYLNTVQLGYIQKIIQSNNVPEHIKTATQQVLIENYTPFVKKIHRNFIQTNAKTMDMRYKRELYHYAMLGLLDSLKTYDGSCSLHRYAEKFIHGRLCRGMNEMSILKSVPFHNVKDGIRTLKPQLVPYDEYWKFEDIQLNRLIETTTVTSNDILEILATSPSGYMRLFYRRYDYYSLKVIRKIADICELEGFSEETYRTKMNEIIEYIRERILYLDY